MTTNTSPGKTFQQLVADAKTQITEITQDQLKQWQKEGKALTLLDVREPSDFETCAISGAINIPRGLLELDINDTVTDFNQPIVAYCGGGSRSALAAQTLQTMGYTQVYSLKGGFRVWIED
jgi:rhodanese-related sulfurtransferase